MKRLVALLLTMMMVLTLAACGGKEEEKTPSNDDKAPSSSQQQEQNTPDLDPVEVEPEETPDDGGEEIVVDVDLFDISDTDITAIKNGKTVMEGDEAAEVIAQIPAEIKKGVGELETDDCEVLANKDFTLFDFKIGFRVPNASVKSYYNAITEYYKSLGGTVTKEEANGDWQDLGMTFDWGEMRGCNYTLSFYDPDTARILVEFYINAN